MVYESAAGRIYGLKCGWADFGSGLICPRAQTCCASPTRTPARLANSPGFKSFRCPRWRIKFSLERFSDLSHICLRIQPLKNSAGRVPQAPRLSHALLLEMGNQCRKTTLVAHFRGSTLQCLRASVCVPSRWKVLSGEFRRPPDFRTLYGLKWATSVEKRHQLPISEARRCSACAHPFACPAVEKFCRASSAGGRRHLQ